MVHLGVDRKATLGQAWGVVQALNDIGLPQRAGHIQRTRVQACTEHRWLAEATIKARNDVFKADESTLGGRGIVDTQARPRAAVYWSVPG